MKSTSVAPASVLDSQPTQRVAPAPRRIGSLDGLCLVWATPLGAEMAQYVSRGHPEDPGDTRHVRLGRDNYVVAAEHVFILPSRGSAQLSRNIGRA